MIINNVAKWRKNRGKNGITKSHLARQVGVSRSYITKLENGDLQPSGKMIFKIAAYFGCRVEDVFKYENEKN